MEVRREVRAAAPRLASAAVSRYFIFIGRRGTRRVLFSVGGYVKNTRGELLLSGGRHRAAPGRHSGPSRRLPVAPGRPATRLAETRRGALPPAVGPTAPSWEPPQNEADCLPAGRRSARSAAPKGRVSLSGPLPPSSTRYDPGDFLAIAPLIVAVKTCE